MKRTKFLFFFFLFLSCSLLAGAQSNNAKSLLWRISGNGLPAPSYLFGTMHLYDRRLFQFGDSVYNSIEQTQGYAMELDPNSMMDTLLARMNDEDTTSLLEQMMNKEEFDSIEEKLEKKMGMPADRVTRKMLMKERQKEIYKRRNKDDMNTVVDLYLYDIARKQGKWVGGVEDVNDQLGITDELGKDFDVKSFIEDDGKKMKVSLDNMIRMYVSEDINKIEEWSGAQQSAAMRDLLLTKRNVKMARRMDSLSALRTTFFAVGAAHLPGDSGVISLLRQRGFVVEPVFSSKKIAPDNYKFTAKEIPWINIAGPDSLYTADMPGKPTDINKYGDELKMKMYGDMGSNSFYLTGFVQIDSTRNKDDIIERIMQSYSSKRIDDKQKKDISNHGIKGFEINAEREKVYCRVQVFLTGNKEYIAIVGAMNTVNLYTKDADRFLQSFVMNNQVEIKNPDWITYTDSIKAFSVNLPKMPEIYKVPPEKTQKYWTSTLYSALDIKSNTYYLLSVNEIQKGYLMPQDSVYFRGQYENFTNDTSYRNVTKKNIEFNGFPAVNIIAQSTSEGEEITTNVTLFNRDNRNFTLISVTDTMHANTPNILKFDNSFKLLPYKISEWKERPGGNGRFSAWSPSFIEASRTDSASLENGGETYEMGTGKKLVEYLMYDTFAAATYNINLYRISPYYWTGNDSTFYKDQTAGYFADTSIYNAYHNSKNFDSLIYARAIKNGDIVGREILVKDAGSNFYKKVRVLRTGDSVYHLFAFVRKSDLDNENNNKFFNNFSVHGNIMPGNIFENKTSKILNDLESIDSATHLQAFLTITSAPFTKGDLPLLLPALVKKYEADTAVSAATNAQIASVLEPLMSDSVVDFIRDAYLKIPGDDGSIKEKLLETLARYKTQVSYNALKNLFIASPPHQNNYSLSYLLTDSLELAATLFPAMEKLYSDSSALPLVIDISVKLIDSALLDKKSVLDNSSYIYAIAKKQLLGYLKDPQNYYGVFSESVIKMLAILDTEQSEQLLNEYVKLSNMDLQQAAVIALLSGNKKVSKTQINKIAADKNYRVYFYNDLIKIGKTNVFPAAWHTQKLFAESYLYNYEISEEDQENLSLQFVAEKTGSRNGKENRYFLFKVTTSYDGEKESHLGICGPFDLDKNNILINEDDEYENVFYEESFDSQKINDLFKTYLDRSFPD